MTSRFRRHTLLLLSLCGYSAATAQPSDRARPVPYVNRVVPTMARDYIADGIVKLIDVSPDGLPGDTIAIRLSGDQRMVRIELPALR